MTTVEMQNLTQRVCVKKKKYIYIYHNQLEQIRCPRQGVVDRIPLDLKAKESNGVQAIWKRKKTKTKYN